MRIDQSCGQPRVPAAKQGPSVNKHSNRGVRERVGEPAAQNKKWSGEIKLGAREDGEMEG